MDVKTRIMIDKITEYVRKEYKIIGPISDIESIVVSMGGIIVEKTAIDDLSDLSSASANILDYRKKKFHDST